MPPRWRTVVCGTVVAVAAALTLWQLPYDARSLHADIANGRSQGDLRRQLAPARTVQITDPEALARAAAVLPRAARYLVLIGPHTPGAAPSNLRWVPPFADYWLLPRRRVGTVAAANWVLSYGGSLASLHVRFARIVPIGPGIAVAQVAR
ncbi:MAG: hypothetical protein ACXVZL_02875 [Gaiellaceae bacterium]